MKVGSFKLSQNLNTSLLFLKFFAAYSSIAEYFVLICAHTATITSLFSVSIRIAAKFIFFIFIFTFSQMALPYIVQSTIGQSHSRNEQLSRLFYPDRFCLLFYTLNGLTTLFWDTSLNCDMSHRIDLFPLCISYSFISWACFIVRLQG